jgi:ceramide glucosyltransferase
MLMVLSLVGVVSSLTYYLGSTLATYKFAARPRTSALSPSSTSRRVALLKPTYDLSDGVLSNLETFLAVDYPHFDVIIGVPGTRDDAEARLRDLRNRYPNRNFIVVTDEEPGCTNRKVARLIRMVEQAPAADVYVMSDADIRVEPDYLRQLMAELDADPRVGMVTCAYRARPLNGLASRFEALMVNTDFAPMVILAEAIEPVRQAFGATIAFKRELLDAIGGFRPLRDMLADDFFLGRHAIEHGFDIRLSSILVTIACDEHRFGQFWHHQLRWARTYRTARPLSVATIIIHGPFWALLLALASRFNIASLAVLLLVLAVRITTASYIIARVLKLPELLRDAWLVPIKDMVMTGVWFVSLFGNHVLWGGRRFKILSDGRMSEIKG